MLLAVRRDRLDGRSLISGKPRWEFTAWNPRAILDSPDNTQKSGQSDNALSTDNLYSGVASNAGGNSARAIAHSGESLDAAIRQVGAEQVRFLPLLYIEIWRKISAGKMGESLDVCLATMDKNILKHQFKTGDRPKLKLWKNRKHQ